MTILILHAIGGHAGDHWEQWLHDELVKKGHTVIMPELPNSDHPDRQTWLKTVQNELEGVNLSELIIVGHSLGVATALDYMEHVVSPVSGFASVSGFAYDYGAELNGYFMREKSIDFKKVLKNAGRCFVFYSDNDPYVTQEALSNLAEELNVQPEVIPSGGHLNSDAGFTEFPQLLRDLNSIL